MKNQRGFIQVPILIIIVALIVIVSVGIGVVLHKQEKLNPLIADISQIFKRADGTIPIEEQKAQPEDNQQEISQQDQELKKEVETKKLIEPEIEKEVEESLEKPLSKVKENQPPQLTLFQDNIVGFHDLSKERGDNIFSCHFGIPESPVQIPVKDYKEIIKKYSIKVGDTLTIKIDGYDPEGGTMLYIVTYFEGQGTTRILQEWSPNNTFTIPITDQLFEKLFIPEMFSNVDYSIERREGDLIIVENYRGGVLFKNGGMLRVSICYNDTPAQMDFALSWRSQCMKGCLGINYFIIKPGLSYYEPHYEQKY